jgi:hypothetical protein
LTEATYYTLTSEVYQKMLGVINTLLGREGDIDEYDSRFLKLFNLNSELLKKEEYSLLLDVFDKCEVGFWNIISELKIFLKEELRKNWKIAIDIDIFGDEKESYVRTSKNIQTPLQKMMKISSMMFQEIINLTQHFLSKYQYHLSILNAAGKLADVLAQSNDNKITIGEDWKNVVANSSYVLYYTDFVRLHPIHDAANFFRKFLQSATKF